MVQDYGYHQSIVSWLMLALAMLSVTAHALPNTVQQISGMEPKT